MNIDPEVLEVLNNSRIIENKVFLPATLERKLYEKTNKVLNLAGGKWNKKEKAHVFSSDPREKLGIALESGKIADTKKEYQAFYTPKEVARELVDYADIRYGHDVLEPSCGEGAIAWEISITECKSLCCVEVNPEAAKLVEDTFGIPVKVADFLTIEPKPAFDRIVMNPPFSRSQDVKHIMHAFKFLRPGGVLIAILSPSFEFRTDKIHVEFNELLKNHGEVLQDLPEGTFKESGTNIRTVVIKLMN